MTPTPPSAFPSIPVPGDCPLLPVARCVNDAGMFLITDGRTVRVSPIVPPGWFRMGVRVKEAA